MGEHEGNERRGLSLNVKLVVSFLALGLLPALLIGWYSLRSSAGALEEAAGKRLEDAAVTDGDIIDRNLFERYGDVQAFAANPMARGQSAQRQDIVDFLMTNYGIYDLMLIVDLDGTVVTANTVDGGGATVDPGPIVGRSVRGEAWFDAVSSGQTPPGGTWYADAWHSPLVEQLYGEARVTLPFTAPILDGSGEMVGVWHNEASFERVVGDVMGERKESFRRQGLTTIEARVLRHDGIVLLDTADPSAAFDVDLAGAAAEAATGEVGSSGFVVETDPQSGLAQVNGFAVADGALGFDGYRWGILVSQGVAEAAAPASVLQRSLTLLTLAIMVITATLGGLLARSLSGPLKRNVIALEGVAQGDLRVRFAAPRADEVGHMAGALNRALDAIGGTLVEVDEGVRGLSASSAHLNEISQEVSGVTSSASSQASAVAASAGQIATGTGSVAHAMEQMNESVREISSTTAATAILAGEAVSITARAKEQMARLDANATEIGGVVDVITSIAEQTNLLALNAAIEAARVGEAGKGFAVVANEVKELAFHTSSATDEIRSTIDAIQVGTLEAVQAIAQISDIIDTLLDASTTIASAAEEQYSTTSAVSDSLKVVNAGTSEISDRIASVASAVDTANGGSARTLQAAAELNSIAERLAGLLDNFDLPDAVDPDPDPDHDSDDVGIGAEPVSSR